MYRLLWMLLYFAAASWASPAPEPPSCSAAPAAQPTASATCAASSVPPPTAAAADPAAADYIIVGGGTAGCVLAARLCAAIPRRTFTLLERGAPRSEASELRVRAMRHAFTAAKDPELARSWLSQPNPGLGGREVSVLAGQTLGGSSAIAGGQWTKPPLSTFDSAAWSFDGLTADSAAALFARAERHLGVAAPPPDLTQSHLHHYLRAAAAAGIPAAPQPPSLPHASASNASIWPNIVTADSAGRRRDAAAAYLAPALAGPCAHNLRIVQPAAVRRIVFERGRAAAVEYLLMDTPGGPQPRRAVAAVEVIVSAGPYGSPQLLQLSGIGPGGVLRMHGITVERELPVGLNSISRPRVGLVDAYTTEFAPENDGAVVNAPATLAQFRGGRGGALGVPVAATNAILPAQAAYTFSSNTAPGRLRGMPLISSVCAINPTPSTRGGVAIASADPLQPPFVHTNLLGTAEDTRRGLACLRRLQDVTRELTPALGLMSVVPGVGSSVDGTLVAETADFLYHTVGGCEVGGVVNGAFRVWGFKGLRVVDASVLPEMPPFAGPLATVYMIAELAAERILQSAGAETTAA